VNAAAASSTDARRTIQQRWSTVCSSPSPPSVTVSDPITNNEIGEQSQVRRTVSDIERPCSTERRSRQIGMDAVDSSSDLLEFLASGDAGVGSGEFVRSGSLRSRRRSSRLGVDAPNHSRERITPPPTSSTTQADSDDPPPFLSRSGPGRWSLRDRVGPRETSSPPLSSSARWAKFMATRRASQDSDDPSAINSGRSISDPVTETDCLLDRPDNSLELRRQAARLRRQSVSPLTTTSDPLIPRPATTSDRLSRWSPTVTDVSESSASSGSRSRRDQLVVDESSSHRRCSPSDVDRAIYEVEKIGKQFDSIVSGAATAGSANRTPRSQNDHQTASDKEQVVMSSGSRHAEFNETRRWGRYFNDDDEEVGYLQRSATLPRRWRCRENTGRQAPDAEKRMEEIAESLQNSPGSPASLDAADSNKQGGPSPRRTLPEIPGVPGVHSVGRSLALNVRESERPTQSDSPTTTTPDETSRPTSAEFDAVSTSSSSRDEGFESAVDNGGQSARSSPGSYPGFNVPLTDDQAASCPHVSDGQTTSSSISEVKSPCEGDDSVSSGTSLFARSIDSLVNHELVITGETIDVDSSPQNGTTKSRETKSGSTAVQRHQTSDGSKQSPTSKKSSLLASITARLSRPGKSSPSVVKTGSTSAKVNSTAAKQPATSSGSASTRTSSVTAAGAVVKSSAFVRDSRLRSTMPASLPNGRTKKSAASTAPGKDPLAPEPPQRTTSIRDSLQTAHRTGPVTSRQQRTVAPAVGKPTGETRTKTDKQITPQSTARGRVAAQEQTKDRDKARPNGPEVRGGRDTLVLYKVVNKPTKSSTAKTSTATTTNTNTNTSVKKQAANSNAETQRTQRLNASNTPQQSRRSFRF